MISIGNASNPFYDWRKPARPCMWSKDYDKHTHVVAIWQAIENYNDGLLTTLEFVSFCDYQYHKGYALGLEDQHYNLPAKYDDYSNPSVWDCVLGYHDKFG